MKKKWIIGCSIPLVIVIVLIGGCMTWLIRKSTYYVETYKPYTIVESGNKKALRDRFTAYEFEDVTIFLEWNTYDNEKINTAPYKLFVVIEPKTSSFHSVEIERVNIQSSLGHDYTFDLAIEWPVIIKLEDDQQRDSYLFEPAFTFEFEKQEEIVTHIEFEIRTGDRAQTETIDVRWIPVRVAHAAPIV